MASGIAAGLTVGKPYLANYLPFLADKERADLILHNVGYEYLPVSVVERGTLESAENLDVICKVKAGSKGTYSSTIKWVIDDGTMVVKNQLLVELDDSALQEQLRNQSILVEKARAEWIRADEEYVITAKQNDSDIAMASALMRVAQLDLEKFIGLRTDYNLIPLAAVAGAPTVLIEKGEYRQLYDDVSGRLKLAESNLEAYRDRTAWARRAVKLGYLTDSQAKVEQSKLDAAWDEVQKLQKEQFILKNFIRERELTDLSSQLEVAQLDFERAQRQARAKLNQSESERKTAYSVYQQELDTLRDIEEQILACKLYAPQDGMVVYFKNSTSRFRDNSPIISTGEQVREGQKLIRIPDLKRMQVTTKVHEAMVSRIRADDRKSTGFHQSMRAGLLVLPHGMTGIINTSENSLSQVREMFRDYEYYIASAGQSASVRIDAFPDRVLQGHVRSVAQIASQADFFSSDTKVYETVVSIDESLDGLKPDMSAEVTIKVDAAEEPVLAVPLQAVIGGAEFGPKRFVYVSTSKGPELRDVMLGAFNDKMVEIREGLQEGERVVLNPKILVGDKAKTREEKSNSRGRTGGNGQEENEQKGSPKGPGGPPGGAAGEKKGPPKN